MLKYLNWEDSCASSGYWKIIKKSLLSHSKECFAGYLQESLDVKFDLRNNAFVFQKLGDQAQKDPRLHCCFQICKLKNVYL